MLAKLLNKFSHVASITYSNFLQALGIHLIISINLSLNLWRNIMVKPQTASMPNFWNQVSFLEQLPHLTVLIRQIHNTDISRYFIIIIPLISLKIFTLLFMRNILRKQCLSAPHTWSENIVLNHRPSAGSSKTLVILPCFHPHLTLLQKKIFLDQTAAS